MTTAGLSVTLNWEPVTPPGSGAVAYYVQRDGSAVAGCSPTPNGTRTCTETVSTAGTYSYAVTAAYRSWTSATTRSVTVAPSGPRPTATNVVLASGIPAGAGRAEQDDTVTITYSAPMDATKFWSAWANSGAPQVLTGIATIQEGANGDSLSVSATGGTFRLGTVRLNADYVASDRTFSNSTFTWNPTAKTLTVKLGAPSGGTRNNVTASTPSYTPDAGLTDTSGNLIEAGPFAGTSSRF